MQKIMLPIGHLLKADVRRIAEEQHLAPAHRKDSQGICFLGKINYNDYIKRYLGEKPGKVIELETGRCLGNHKGLWFHTIGQRKGLGFGEGPWFAVKKDMQKNILYVSKGYDPVTAYKNEFFIHDLHLLTPCDLPERVSIKIRHTPVFTDASIFTADAEGVYRIALDAPIHGVAPGQFCVIYDSDHHRCYGSGEITVASV